MAALASFIEILMLLPVPGIPSAMGESASTQLCTTENIVSTMIDDFRVLSNSKDSSSVSRSRQEGPAKWTRRERRMIILMS